MQTVARQPVRRRPRGWSCCSWPLLLLGAIVLYLFAPVRTNILLLGTDDSAERGSIGRTDTMILMTVVPLKPYVGMLSIPRDLWVVVPGVGEQRINTAYFFAETNQAGSGARAAMQTIHENFDVPVGYYAVIHMAGLTSIIDALGGVEVRLDSALGGYPAGPHHFNGEQALLFVRERSSSDDFSRMARTQILITAMFRKAMNPSAWISLPQVLFSLSGVIDTNIPLWQWPRLLFAFFRGLVTGIDGQTITREMVVPFQTSQGAQVLAPNWEAIRPVLSRMFGG